jgi:integrase
MPLTAIAVKQAKSKEKSYKLSDEKGMFLLINPNGSKYWRYKYRFGGKEKLLALGVYPDLSLSDARELRDQARNQLAKGIDPSAAKRVKKQAQVTEGGNSFKIVASEWFETQMKDKAKGYQERTWRGLKNDLFPALGSRPINQITATELLMALRKVEARGAVDMAHRVKQTAGQVFRYGVATGRCERDPTGDLRGALQPVTKKHFAAITEPKAAGNLMLAIDAYEGTPVVKTALQLSAILFQRPGEIRAMEWEEIDWEAERWEIPADKMKMKQQHIVPLSSQAIDQLKELHRITGRGRYVFPSARGPHRPLSDNGVRVALRAMGYDNEAMTAHGFRAMARTILDEVLNYRVDYIEHQLAHAVKDANGRAYNRTAHLAGRKEMMQGWADYLDNLKAQAKAGNVITAKFGSQDDAVAK